MSALETRLRETCSVAWLGLLPYQEAWDLQRGLARARAEGRVGDTLLLLEHPHVYTIGRRGQDADVSLDSEGLRCLGVTLFQVDRGGQVTYHGPGQLVGYPIIGLRDWGGGPLAYVRALERVLIDTLADFGIPAQRSEGFTGVWVNRAKIAAIGVKISAGVTLHGFALNVDPDLSYYRYIVPCGIPDCQVTSMARYLGRTVPMDEVRDATARHFRREFRFAMRPASLDALEEAAQIPVAP